MEQLQLPLLWFMLAAYLGAFMFYVAEVYAIPFLVIDFAVGGYLGNFSFLLSSIYVKFAVYIP